MGRTHCKHRWIGARICCRQNFAAAGPFVRLDRTARHIAPGVDVGCACSRMILSSSVNSLSSFDCASMAALLLGTALARSPSAALLFSSILSTCHPHRRRPSLPGILLLSLTMCQILIHSMNALHDPYGSAVDGSSGIGAVTALLHSEM